MTDSPVTEPVDDVEDELLTLEQLEAEVAPTGKPFRFRVDADRVLELKSPLHMGAAAFERVMSAMNSSQALGEMGEVAAVVQLLPAMIGEDNYQVLLDADISLMALVRLQEKVEAYYSQELASIGVDDPKGSTSR